MAWSTRQELTGCCRLKGSSIAALQACDGALFVAEDAVVNRYNNRDFTHVEGEAMYLLDLCSREPGTSQGHAIACLLAFSPLARLLTAACSDDGLWQGWV